jgi:2Fe-2S ferredoxin
MPHVTYISLDGERTTVELSEGTTVKDGALQNGIDGIVGECGGNGMCATCHVYVAPDWGARLPAMTDVEDALLDDTASPRQTCSRLGCQLPVDADLDGLVVRIPEEQQ